MTVQKSDLEMACEISYGEDHKHTYRFYVIHTYIYIYDHRLTPGAPTEEFTIKRKCASSN